MQSRFGTSAAMVSFVTEDRLFLKAMANLCYDRLEAYREKHTTAAGHDETAIVDSKRGFLRMISHEFKTPLNAIDPSPSEASPHRVALVLPRYLVVSSESGQRAKRLQFEEVDG